MGLAVAQCVSVPRGVAENVRRHVVLAARAADHGARFVVFPELSLTSYDLTLAAADALTPDDRRLRPLAAVARARDITVVAGAPMLAPDGLRIAAVIFHPDGTTGTHSKRYLHAGEEVAFVPGPGGAPLPLGDQVVGLAICADITHAEHAGAAAGQGATVYAAGCLISDHGYAPDTALLESYATEHGLLVLLANYGAPTGGWASAGRSAIWAPPDGRRLAEAPPSGEALVIAHRSGAGWAAQVILE